MAGPEFRLGTDGELEEAPDTGEKPKGKRKRRPFGLLTQRLQIPLLLFLLLPLSIAALALTTYILTRPAASVPTATPSAQMSAPQPTVTPGGFVDGLAPCGLMAETDVGRIVFRVWPEGTDMELLQVNVDGTNLCRLTNNEATDDHPSWSPDGQQIAYTSIYHSPVYEYERAVYIVDANGENLVKLTTGFGSVDSPAWSPDGSLIAFVGSPQGSSNADIFVIGVDGQNLNNLTNYPGIDSSPSWSPDGQRIVFSSDRTFDRTAANGVSQPDSYEIYVMDADGSNIQRLTTNEITDTGPDWSPDGQMIVYMSDNVGSLQSDIHIMSPSGANNRRLITGNYGRAEWLADSRSIMFPHHNAGSIRILNIVNGHIDSVQLPMSAAHLDVWWPDYDGDS